MKDRIRPEFFYFIQENMPYLQKAEGTHTHIHTHTTGWFDADHHESYESVVTSSVTRKRRSV